MVSESAVGQRGEASAKSLSASSVRFDFGPRTKTSQLAIGGLCAAASRSKRADELLSRWKAYMGLPEAAIELLEGRADVPFGRQFSKIKVHPDLLLFAIQTYFALVVKCVAMQIISRDDLADCGPGKETLSYSSRLLSDIDSGIAFRELGIEAFPDDQCFNWYSDLIDDGLLEALSAIWRIASNYRLAAQAQQTGAECHELFGELYTALIPQKLRHALGEYYTPEWLVDFVLDQAGYDGDPSLKVIDPSCGSGAFLIRALGRALKRAGQLGSIELPKIAGIDVNPLAVLSAKANYLIALRDRMRSDGCAKIPIYRYDLITGDYSRQTEPTSKAQSGPKPRPNSFDLVVGNPPWVHWDNLSSGYREATKPLWFSYGLFSLSGSKGRMGGGKKDLSMLFVYRSIDRLLKSGGRLAFLITQTVFKTRGAGDGFRRLNFDSRSGPVFIEVDSVHDLTALSPFKGASNRTAILICKKSHDPTHYPVRYSVWRKSLSKQSELFAEKSSPIEKVERIDMNASPIDGDRFGSPWLTVPYGLMGPVRKMIGPSAYKAHEGVNCAGLAGCFIVRVLEKLPSGDLLIENVHDIGKISVKKVRAVVEQGLVFPHLLGRDLRKWNASASVHVILSQDPETRTGIDEKTMNEQFPKTREYLSQFEPQLRQRAAFKMYFNPKDHPFWSMFNIGTYTLERWRVGWRIMGSKMEAAVLPFQGDKPVLPQNTHAFVSCGSEREAHYLCAMLNSAPVLFLIRSYSVSGGKSFAPPHIMEYVRIQLFDDSKEAHIKLAELSMNCHERASEPAGRFMEEAAREIDRLASEAFGIPARRMDGFRDFL
ncbi:MAG: N-6 DNA methylase [Candidatus Coatesbacteria bacterium]|nr:N-6 DNA methylase [Candidatus Coatesbacteria bacterium]